MEQTASGEVLPDSLALLAQNEYEALLDEASDYANEAYYCNVDGEYLIHPGLAGQADWLYNT